MVLIDFASILHRFCMHVPAECDAICMLRLINATFVTQFSSFEHEQRPVSTLASLPRGNLSAAAPKIS